MGYKITGKDDDKLFARHIGKKYGTFTIKEYLGYQICYKRKGKRLEAGKTQIMRCDCDCGNEVIISLPELKAGKTVCKNCDKGVENMKSVNESAKVKIETTEAAETATKPETVETATKPETVETVETIETATKSSDTDVYVVRTDYSNYKQRIDRHNNSVNDIVGEKVGHIEVLEYAYALQFEIDDSHKVGFVLLYKGRCDCGNECLVSRKELMSGKNLVCGKCMGVGLTDAADTGTDKQTDTTAADTGTDTQTDTTAADTTDTGTDKQTDTVDTQTEHEDTATTDTDKQTEQEDTVMTEHSTNTVKPEFEGYVKCGKIQYDKLVGHKILNAFIYGYRFNNFKNRRTVTVFAATDSGVNFCITGNKMWKAFRGEITEFAVADSKSDIWVTADTKSDKNEQSHKVNSGKPTVKPSVEPTGKNTKAHEREVINMKNLDDIIVMENGELNVDKTFVSCMCAVMRNCDITRADVSITEQNVANKGKVTISNDRLGVFCKRYTDIVVSYSDDVDLRNRMLAVLIEGYIK